jgi:hypothetical protein
MKQMTRIAQMAGCLNHRGTQIALNRIGKMQPLYHHFVFYQEIHPPGAYHFSVEKNDPAEKELSCTDQKSTSLLLSLT